MNTPPLDDGELALYALHLLPPDAALAVEAAAVADPQLRARLDAQEQTLAELATREAHPPPAPLKQRMLTAVADEAQREAASGRFPLLHSGTRAADLETWLRAHARPSDGAPSHCVPLDESSDRETTLMWLDDAYPEEVHTSVVERILILEGTCAVYIGTEVRHYRAGDLIRVPLHMPHSVRVTSAVACKAVVQRVSA